jgi:hypothetical protein
MQRPVVLVVPVVVLRKIQQIHLALHPRVMQVAQVNQQQHAPLQVVVEVLVQSVYKDLRNATLRLLTAVMAEVESRALSQVHQLDMPVVAVADRTTTVLRPRSAAGAVVAQAIFTEPEMAQTQIKVLVATLERILDQVVAVATMKVAVA